MSSSSPWPPRTGKELRRPTVGLPLASPRAQAGVARAQPSAPEGQCHRDGYSLVADAFVCVVDRHISLLGCGSFNTPAIPMVVP